MDLVSDFFLFSRASTGVSLTVSSTSYMSPGCGCVGQRETIGWMSGACLGTYLSPFFVGYGEGVSSVIFMVELIEHYGIGRCFFDEGWGGTFLGGNVVHFLYLDVNGDWGQRQDVGGRVP